MSEQNSSSPAMNEHVEEMEEMSGMSKTPANNPVQRQTNLSWILRLYYQY